MRSDDAIEGLFNLQPESDDELELKTLEWIEVVVLHYLDTAARDPQFNGPRDVRRFRSHVLGAMATATKYCESETGQREIESLRKKLPNTPAALEVLRKGLLG